MCALCLAGERSPEDVVIDGLEPDEPGSTFVTHFLTLDETHIHSNPPDSSGASTAGVYLLIHLLDPVRKRHRWALDIQKI